MDDTQNDAHGAAGKDGKDGGEVRISVVLTAGENARLGQYALQTYRSKRKAAAALIAKGLSLAGEDAESGLLVE